MEILEFTYFAIPYIIVFYLAVLLFIRPPRTVVLASLLATVAVAILFSLAIFGAAQASERRSVDRRAGAAYGAVAVVCLAGCLVAVAYGIALLATK